MRAGSPAAVLLLAVAFLAVGCERPAPQTSVLGAAPAVATGPLRIDTLAFGRFGRVVVYRRSEHPAHVVLFASGDGGWNLGVVAMAEELASLDATVVGIDMRRFQAVLNHETDACSYPAADLEALSQWLQRKLGYTAYTTPILVGYSSGATLVYAAAVQAPPGTFRGVLSLGFCPDLALHRPWCQGAGLTSLPEAHNKAVRFLPADSMSAPWIVLQGAADSTCSAAQATAYVHQVAGARVVLLPHVGHGFGVESRWVPQFRAAFRALAVSDSAPAQPTAADMRGLPLVELHAASGGRRLAIIVSGDGGWASLDRQIGETFSREGVSVVGLDALRYFWTARTPEEMGADLTRIARYYMPKWGATELLLVGYSRGADVLPFMASRLPPDLRDRVRLVALLAPGRTTAFEFHLTDWLGGRHAAGTVPTAPEIGKLTGLRLLCVYGTDDRSSVCPTLAPGTATVGPMAGGHHFDGAYRALAARILEAAGGS